MKNVVLVLAVSISLESSIALASPVVIYGEDNRQEVYQASPAMQRLASAAGTMIETSKLTASLEEPGLSSVEQRTLSDWLAGSGSEAESPKFCSDEPFVNQPNAGMCSGFLIAPDLLVTAGHCVEVSNFCDKYSWVFDYQVDQDSKTAGTRIKKENIYSCKRVISYSLQSDLGLDYGLIQLDRIVEGRKPVLPQTRKQTALGEGLVVIGNPSGLPLKVAAGANVRESTHPFFFTANLDTFQGNSGSAVFNSNTGEVEGILVRGEDDYEMNGKRNCVEAKKCANDECRGEDVSRITSIPEVAIRDTLMTAVGSGDLELLDKILALNFWVDIYGPSRVSALMKASASENFEVVIKLLERGADVNLTDLDGNTSLHLASAGSQTRDIIKALVIADANIEAKNSLGQTPLLKAASTLNLEGVINLILLGAEKNALDNNGETALFAFMRDGNTEAVKTLINFGVDQEIRNNKGESALEVNDVTLAKYEAKFKNRP